MDETGMHFLARQLVVDLARLAQSNEARALRSALRSSTEAEMEALAVAYIARAQALGADPLLWSIPARDLGAQGPRSVGQSRSPRWSSSIGSEFVGPGSQEPMSLRTHFSCLPRFLSKGPCIPGFCPRSMLLAGRVVHYPLRF